MALPVDENNPCSILSDLTVTSGSPAVVTTQLYPALTASGIPSTNSVNWGALAASGILKEFDTAVTALLGAKLLGSRILQANNSSSTYRLIQFLSGGGAANKDPDYDYSTLADTLLYTGTTSRTYGGIVGRIIAKVTSQASQAGQPPMYLYPMQADEAGKPVPLLSDAMISGDFDTTTNNPIAGSSCIVAKLMNDGLLLKKSDIYATGADGKMTSGSLFYFYDATQKGTITPDEVKLRSKLEATNLRFYGAFFVEYCYYKCRYELLLSEYFTAYQQTTDENGTYTVKNNTSPQAPLFSQPETYRPTATDKLTNQTQYLNALAFHLACVNTRLIDMTRVLDAIKTYYSGVFTSLQTALNGRTDTAASTAAVAAAVVALQTSSVKAAQYLKDEDFRKGVMEYTSEKNRYANILLGFYAFLNLSALAVIVYSM